MWCTDEASTDVYLCGVHKTSEVALALCWLKRLWCVDQWRASEVLHGRRYRDTCIEASCLLVMTRRLAQLLLSGVIVCTHIARSHTFLLIVQALSCVGLKANDFGIGTQPEVLVSGGP